MLSGFDYVVALRGTPDDYNESEQRDVLPYFCAQA
jgi:hypothetical protein